MQENLTPCYRIDGSTDPDDWGEVPTSSNSTWNAATCDFEANGYRLPTEAEWEWLARGGEDYKYAGSDNVDDVAWYTSNTNYTGTREVKTKAPNGYGLYDMSGNVYEWCWDWYGSISSSSAADGAASGNNRVQRGGSWYYNGDYCRVAYRYGDYPSCRYYYHGYGFRVVRPSSK
jgi:formylglycine-generating enzyme required for sulfatase activity